MWNVWLKTCFIRTPVPSVWSRFLHYESVENKVLNVELWDSFGNSTCGFPDELCWHHVALRSALPVLDPELHCYPGTRRSNPLLPETCSTLHPPQISAIWILRTASLEQPVEDATVREVYMTDTLLRASCFKSQAQQVFLFLKINKKIKTTQEPLGWHLTAASWCAAGRDTERAGQRWCNAAPASFPGAAQFAVSSARTQSPSTLAGFKPTQTQSAGQTQNTFFNKFLHCTKCFFFGFFFLRKSVLIMYFLTPFRPKLLKTSRNKSLSANFISHQIAGNACEHKITNKHIKSS